MGRFKSNCGKFTISDKLLDVSYMYHRLGVNNPMFFMYVLEKLWYEENISFLSEEEFTDTHFEFYMKHGFIEASKGRSAN